MVSICMRRQFFNGGDNFFLPVTLYSFVSRGYGHVLAGSQAAAAAGRNAELYDCLNGQVHLDMLLLEVSARSGSKL